MVAAHAYLSRSVDGIEPIGATVLSLLTPKWRTGTPPISQILTYLHDCSSKKHRNFLAIKKDAAGSCKLSDIFKTERRTTATEPDDMGVIRAEVMMSEMIVKLNLPLSAADILNKTVCQAFPDSTIAKNYTCARNRTREIVQCLATNGKTSLRKKIFTKLVNVYILICKC